MAKDKNNPIKYSDLIQPDNAIVQLIKQLETLKDTYADTLKEVREEAKKLIDALKGVSGATEEGRQTTKKAMTDAERLARAEEQLTFAQGETAKNLAKLNQAKQEQNRINKLVVKLNNAQEGSYDRLSAQYALNKIRINAMTKAEREAAEASEKLISKTKEMYEEMKSLQEETGKFQLNVGNYENSLKSAFGLNNEFGESLLAMGRGGEEAKSALAGMKDGALALGRSLLTLMSNPVFLAIAGVAAVGTAFKFWYDYNAGLIEATRLTQQFTGKSGGDLKNYRNQVQAVADTFNVDFREALMAANALSKQMGISADEAMKLIKDGFIAGANANGEFLDSVKEYPAYLKEAGIDAKGFVAILAQTNKAGIFSDKGIDAIKEANLRIREMTPATAAALDAIGISSEKVQSDLRQGLVTTFDVMQMVSVKLNELPDSASEVGTAIADIFGGPGEDAGLQYLRTLKDISLDLDKVKGKAGELGRLQEKQLQSEIELQNALAGLFDLTGGTFEEMTTSVKVFVNNALTSLIKGVINLANYFIEFYNNSLLLRVLWNTITRAFKDQLDIIGNGFRAIGDMLVGIGRIIKGTFTFDWEEYKRGAKDYLLAIPRFVKNSVKDVKKNIDESITNINGKLETIKVPISVVPASSSGNGRVSGKGGKKQVEDAIKEEMSGLNLNEILGNGPTELTIDGGIKGLAFGKAEVAQIREFSKSLKDIAPEESKDIYDLLGLTLNDKTKEGISSSLEYAKSSIYDLMNTKIEAANRAVEASKREVDEAQRSLEIEKTARANGYASNVALAQKELDLAKRNQEKALQEQQKAQKRQLAMQSVEQASNLVTASAGIWKSFAGVGPWGIAAAVAAIALMWSTFAASKIKAAQLTKGGGTEKYAEGTVELLEGGSHQSGRDIDLGTKPDGTRRRAEGGEYFAVINKRNSRRYRSLIPSVIHSLNDGSFANKYLHAYEGAEGMNVVVQQGGSDLKGLESDVREIRDMNRRKSFTDGNGNLVVEYKNLRRTYK